MSEKTAQQLREEAEALVKQSLRADRRALELRAEARRIEREERQKAQIAARRRLSDRLYDEMAGGIAGFNRAQHNVIFRAAWDRGRDSGDYAVASEYGELAEFVRKVMELSD